MLTAHQKAAIKYIAEHGVNGLMSARDGHVGIRTARVLAELGLLTLSRPVAAYDWTATLTPSGWAVAVS
jgi:hypothetical protein